MIFNWFNLTSPSSTYLNVLHACPTTTNSRHSFSWGDYLFLSLTFPLTHTCSWGVLFHQSLLFSTVLQPDLLLFIIPKWCSCVSSKQEKNLWAEILILRPNICPTIKSFSTAIIWLPSTKAHYVELRLELYCYKSGNNSGICPFGNLFWFSMQSCLLGILLVKRSPRRLLTLSSWRFCHRRSLLEAMTAP